MVKKDKECRKICIFTGSRAEYGLLKPLMDEIDRDPELVLQIMVSGMHLSPEYGLTYMEVEKDGFHIDEKIEILLSSDSSIGICKSTGLGLISFGEAFQRLEPDILVVLGDRFETFAAAAGAMIKQIPIAHIHGGEITLGAIDEQIRHAITKMSHVHFTSTQKYKDRVVQLGEIPENVHNVGALGVENIKKLDLLTKEKFEEIAGFYIPDKSFLVTYHPVPLEKKDSMAQLENLFRALDDFETYFIIFTKSNSDEQGRIINKMIDRYCQSRDRAVSVTSLGQLLYLSALKYARAVVGNSSSGIIEAPSLKIPTVNIGSRQQGRIQAESIIDCRPISDDISKALAKAVSSEFRREIHRVINPYEKENTAKEIKQILKSVRLDSIMKKKFHDLKL